MFLRLTPGTVTAETDDGTILLNQRSGGYWQLNPTGAQALAGLLAGRAPDRIADDFSATYGISAAQARTDLTALTEHLVAAGLVEAV
ncbi:lasso peptide biosynthesis PqqD family chaperone [Streptomyces sp. NPDC001262]|uniref:lasso peptide biosynthesis PqqD family chaperone n=1 Tax=Streptomyces TaxID=1883 RepID=UPI0036B04271